MNLFSGCCSWYAFIYERHWINLWQESDVDIWHRIFFVFFLYCLSLSLCLSFSPIFVLFISVTNTLLSSVSQQSELKQTLSNLPSFIRNRFNHRSSNVINNFSSWSNYWSDNNSTHKIDAMRCQFHFLTHTTTFWIVRNCFDLYYNNFLWLLCKANNFTFQYIFRCSIFVYRFIGW